jgi:hypothetical protein
MPDDIVATDRIFHDGFLVAVNGDRINAADAKRWGVGKDGTASADEPAPKKATKAAARTRPAKGGEAR